MARVFSSEVYEEAKVGDARGKMVSFVYRGYAGGPEGVIGCAEGTRWVTGGRREVLASATGNTVLGPDWRRRGERLVTEGASISTGDFCFLRC